MWEIINNAKIVQHCGPDGGLGILVGDKVFPLSSATKLSDLQNDLYYDTQVPLATFTMQDLKPNEWGAMSCDCQYAEDIDFSKKPDLIINYRASFEDADGNTWEVDCPWSERKDSWWPSYGGDISGSLNSPDEMLDVYFNVDSTSGATTPGALCVIMNYDAESLKDFFMEIYLIKHVRMPIEYCDASGLAADIAAQIKAIRLGG